MNYYIYGLNILARLISPSGVVVSPLKKQIPIPEGDNMTLFSNFKVRHQWTRRRSAALVCTVVTVASLWAVIHHVQLFWAERRTQIEW